jgi:hypothetical protein
MTTLCVVLPVGGIILGQLLVELVEGGAGVRLTWSYQRRYPVMSGCQVLCSVMIGLVGATHDRSSSGFKVWLPAGLDGMVLRGLRGDRVHR